MYVANCSLSIVDVSVAYNSTSLLQSSSRVLKEFMEEVSTTLAGNLFHVLLIDWLISIDWSLLKYT